MNHRIIMHVICMALMLPANVNAQADGPACSVTFEEADYSTSDWELEFAAETANDVSYSVLLIGYGDLGKTPEFNEALAERRLRTVKDKLLEHKYAGTILTENRGSTDPGRYAAQVEIYWAKLKPSRHFSPIH